MTKIEKEIKETVEPIINGLNYRVYDVIYEKEAGENYLRIFIDNDSSISLDDCEIVNNAINDILDEKDFIKNAYILEVSSPGLEKRIRNDDQLKQCIGKKVDVKLYKKIQENNTKEIIGILDSFNENEVLIRINQNDNKKGKKDKNNNCNTDDEKIQKNSNGKNNIIKKDEQIITIEKSNIAKMNTVFEF